MKNFIKHNFVDLALTACLVLSITLVVLYQIMI